jgi:hypothetical protein
LFASPSSDRSLRGPRRQRRGARTVTNGGFVTRVRKRPPGLAGWLARARAGRARGAADLRDQPPRVATADEPEAAAARSRRCVGLGPCAEQPRLTCRAPVWQCAAQG